MAPTPVARSAMLASAHAQPHLSRMSRDTRTASEPAGRRDNGGRSVWARIRGAALLDGSVYEEVAEDPRATVQAACVVVVASLAVASSDYPLGWAEMVKAAAAAVLQWWVWTGIAYVVGGTWLGGAASWAALLRTLGFARAPGVLAALAPLIGGIHLAAQAWVLVAGTAALRRTLRVGTARALVAALAGMLPYWFVQFFYLH